jgi:pimeloyl-ACP methyl ester carboxylesterase
MMLVNRRTVLLSAGATLLTGCAPIRAAELPVLAPGAGKFTMSGGKGHEQHVITVHYYRPTTHHRRSPVLIVIPGAGRNGDDYRDAWIEFAERSSVLIAAPSYAEADYDAAAYQMGGAIQNLVIGEPLPGSKPGVLYLRDEDLRFDVNPRREEWLFGDFDRLFELLRSATKSRQQGYDLFGHSAGGQVLHRLVLLQPRSRARRIVAANAGFYTLPDLDTPQPTGLAGLGLDASSLRESFACDLTVLLGENDNHPEQGGSHLRTPTIDAQGDNRLARGRFFHAFGAQRAREMQAAFRWNLRTVAGVGHDYRGMSAAAAKLLYG